MLYKRADTELKPCFVMAKWESKGWGENWGLYAVREE